MEIWRDVVEPHLKVRGRHWRIVGDPLLSKGIIGSRRDARDEYTHRSQDIVDRKFFTTRVGHDFSIAERPEINPAKLVSVLDCFCCSALIL